MSFSDMHYRLIFLHPLNCMIGLVWCHFEELESQLIVIKLRYWTMKLTFVLTLQGGLWARVEYQRKLLVHPNCGLKEEEVAELIGLWDKFYCSLHSLWLFFSIANDDLFCYVRVGEVKMNTILPSDPIKRISLMKTMVDSNI